MFYKKYPNYKFQTFDSNYGIAKKPFRGRNPLLFRTIYVSAAAMGFYLLVLNAYHALRESTFIRNIYLKKKSQKQLAELFLSLPNCADTDPVERFSQF